jgi:hypothetical protein
MPVLVTSHGIASVPSSGTGQLTTSELNRYRAELKQTIAFLERTNPTALLLSDLRAWLDAIRGEEQTRVRIALRNGSA